MCTFGVFGVEVGLEADDATGVLVLDSFGVDLGVVLVVFDSLGVLLVVGDSLGVDFEDEVDVDKGVSGFDLDDLDSVGVRGSTIGIDRELGWS